MNVLLSIPEAAARYRVSVRTVRRHAREALRKLGRRTLVDPSVLSQKLQIEFPADNLSEPLKPTKEESMLQRRSWARGSVYPRKGKRGTVWYGRFWEHATTASGEPVRRYRKVRLGDSTEIPNRTKARDELRRRMDEKRQVAVVMTFTELCDRWESVHERTLRPSTFHQYRRMLKRLRPVFGARLITDLTRHDYERFLLDRARSYSKSTVRSLHVALSQVLSYAVSNDWLEKNPVSGIRLPRNFGGRTVERSVLDRAHVQALSAALAEPCSTLVEFLYHSGLRISEARDLLWSDLTDGVLHVRGTKSAGANRKLPLPDSLIEKLRSLTVKGDHIFHGRNGAPLDQRNWLRREVQPVAKKLGIQLGGWHDFRHAASRRLRQQGTHPKLVSAILGHSKVNLAMDVYDRATVDELRVPLQLNPIEPKTEAVA